MCTHVRIEADKDLVHLTNDNFAYIVDNDDSNKNFFDNGNEGEVNEDRKQFPVFLEGTPVDVDKLQQKWYFRYICNCSPPSKSGVFFVYAIVNKFENRHF